MQLVIEIPEKVYNLLKGDGVDWLGAQYVLGCVAEGQVLPNGHGDLIDRGMQDDVIMRLNENDWQITRGEYKRFDRILFEFPVIVPREEASE